MKHLVTAIATLALCCLSVAQSSPDAVDNTQKSAAILAQHLAAEAAPHSPLATSRCSFTFQSGTRDSFLKFCVTVNGNITQLETPAGSEHIAVFDVGEGYGICDLVSNTAYFDYADSGDSRNWGPASVVKQTAKSVTIGRTTSDGIWELVQTFTQNPGTSSVNVAMKLVNHSVVDRTAFVLRYADVDAGGEILNNLDATFHGAFGWNSVGLANGVGLAQQSVGNWPFGHQGFFQFVPGGPAPCDPFKNAAFGVHTATDGSLVHIYDVPVGKNFGSKTVTINYKAQ